MLKTVPFDLNNYVADRQICMNAVKSASPDVMGLLRQLVKKYQNIAEAHYLLSRCIVAKPPSEEVLNHAFLASELAPDKADYLIWLGEVYHALRLFEKAVPVLRRATLLDPHVFQGWYVLAKSCEYQGLGDEAQAAYSKAIRLPTPPDLRKKAEVGLAMSFSSTSKNSAAIELLWKLYRSNPKDNSRFIAQIAQIGDKPNESKLNRLLDVALSDTNSSPSTRKLLLLAKGKVHDRGGKHEAAFKTWTAAREIDKAHQLKIRDHQKELESITKFYSQPLYDQFLDFGHGTDSMVFIAGMPRSGTTLTEQIIASHPHACGVGEFGRWSSFNKYLRQIVASRNPSETTEGIGRQINELAAETLQILKELSKGNTTKIVEKLPHNFMHLGFERLLFPRSRFIHILRHPYDTFLSSFQANLNSNHGYAFDQVTYAKEYLFHLDLMRYWKALFPDQIMTIHYEELVRDPQSLAPKIISFCGLEWDPNCLEFYKSDKIVRTLSKSQVRNPVYISSVYRWKKYEKHLGPIIEAFDTAGFKYPEF